VIYPPSLTKLETVLVTGNIGLDTENGRDIAYERILSACSLYENPPAFFPADSQDFGGLDIADKVPLWMRTAAQVSPDGRKQVPENGRDVGNSESDSENLAVTRTVSSFRRAPNRFALQALRSPSQRPESPICTVIEAHHTGIRRWLAQAHHTFPIKREAGLRTDRTREE
jgi:hypothetical protein